MKLLNMNEDIPKFFYVFLDFNDEFGFMHYNNFKLSNKIYSGMVANVEINYNNYRKKYLEGSQKYLPYVQAEEFPMSPTSFSSKTIMDYTLEYNMELYRYANVGKYPSRLSGVYAFGDYQTCIKVSNLYNWNIKSVKKFKLSDDLRMKEFTRVTKHNMEIVSYLRSLNCTLFSREDQNIVYEHYWSGKGNMKLLKGEKEYNTGEIYEYLIEGILELVED